MEKINIKYAKILPVKDPKWEYGNNGIDFYTPDNMPTIELLPGEIHKFSLGIKFELPDDIYIYICNKSSWGALGVDTMCPLIDTNYRGELHCVLKNANPSKSFILRPGIKICQGIIMQQPRFELKQTNYISADTNRGENGFGSTGQE